MVIFETPEGLAEEAAKRQKTKREKLNAYFKKYYHSHKPKFAAYMKKWMQKNRIKRNEYQRKYRRKYRHD